MGLKCDHAEQHDNEPYEDELFAYRSPHDDNNNKVCGECGRPGAKYFIWGLVVCCKCFDNYIVSTS